MQWTETDSTITPYQVAEIVDREYEAVHWCQDCERFVKMTGVRNTLLSDYQNDK
jgi:hypothetical protein